MLAQCIDSSNVNWWLLLSSCDNSWDYIHPLSLSFKAENIIMIELDMPNRTTRDYEGPAVAPKVQAALDAALQDEEDLTLDAE